MNSLERLKRRYERTPTKCPACGYVDREGNWSCKQRKGAQAEYHYVCPECGAERTHYFTGGTR